MNRKEGQLILVATPIGNPDDLSPRAAAALAACDLILAEDTRVTGQLLAPLAIRTPLWSYHEHNERQRVAAVLERLAAGDTVALVSDAGLPAISDPGLILVQAVLQAGHRLTAVPGPNAALTALQLSGLDTRRFVFEGFLPARGRERRERLVELARESRTVILYEAPHRLLLTLEELKKQGLSGRRLVLARELTKRYEEVWRGRVAEALIHLQEQPARGEYVLVLEGTDEAGDQMLSANRERARDFARERLATDDRQTVRGELERHFALSRNEAYRLVEELSRGILKHQEEGDHS